MKAIIACDPNGGIGYKNKLPWINIQGDLPRFKKLTNGQVIVMGRNTWDSLQKKPLTQRFNFIITTKKIVLPFGAIALPNLEHFIKYTNAWLIGGAQLINSNWHLITEVHLTRTFEQYTCDVHFSLPYLENYFKCNYIETNSDHTYEIWNKI